MEQITKNLDSLKMGNKIIEKMASINITGNIIPMIWFKKILYPSGKPNLLAINILADIVYWYRPTEIRDEKTGEIIAYKKKFSADLLQRNYEQISKMFGCSKREATNAIICLENLGLIKRIFRKINDNGLVMSNVLFLELNPDKVLEITYQDLSISETVDNTNQSGGCHFQKGEGPLLKGGGSTSKSETYTENTTNNTTNIFLKKENLIKEKRRKSNIDDLISVIENYTENEELKEKLIEHLETRKIKKAAMTLSAIEESLKKLDKYSNNDEEKILMVQNAIISGWTGFYPLSYAEKKQTNKKSGKLFDKPSYDLDAYEKLDGITAFGKLKNKSVSLNEMLRIDKEERKKEYIEVEAKEYD